MAKVEPIRNLNEIEQIEDKLFSLGTERADRMFVMFEVGIFLGVRIGDMIRMKVGDIRGKETYRFIPEKTDTHAGAKNYKAKELTLTIPPELRNMAASMFVGMPDNWPILASNRMGPDDVPLPITRKTAWADMKDIQKMCSIKYPIGCHTLRKTFGYHVYLKNHDVAWLQSWFQHSSPAVTLIYIGIADDERKAVTDNMPYKNRGRFDYRSKRMKKS